MVSSAQARSIRMAYAERLMQWLNALDTSEMTVKQFRSALYDRLNDPKYL